MSTIRMLTMIAALAAAACHDKAADKPSGAEKASGAEAPAGPGTPPPGARPVISEADAQRFYGFVEKLASLAVANQDDCVKLAAALNAYIDANMALIHDAGALQKQKAAMPPAFQEKLAKTFKDELGPAVTRKCGTDKDVRAALEKLTAR